MKVILNSRDITDKLRKITIQEGTQRSDALIIKLYYTDGNVDSKVALPFEMGKTHVIVRRENSGR